MGVAASDEIPAAALPRPASRGHLRLRRSPYTEADRVRGRERIRARNWG